MVNVLVQKLPHSEGLPLPSYGSVGAAGLDFLAAIEGELFIKPSERVLIPTGLAIALPQNYELQIRPRSGLAFKNGLMVLNSPGTIDEDYRGEIKVLLMNAGQEDFKIERGMRIAQGVLAPVFRIEWQETESLEETTRGMKGFGSTGV